MNKAVFCLSLLLAGAANAAIAETGKLPVGQTPAAATPGRPQSATDARCPPETGSHIRAVAGSDGRCDRSAFIARSYDAEDLRRTGEIDLGRALEKLDPGIRR